MGSVGLSTGFSFFVFWLIFADGIVSAYENIDFRRWARCPTAQTSINVDHRSKKRHDAQLQKRNLTAWVMFWREFPIWPYTTKMKNSFLDPPKSEIPYPIVLISFVTNMTLPLLLGSNSVKRGVKRPYCPLVWLEVYIPSEFSFFTFQRRQYACVSFFFFGFHIIIA
jgi:hypothetical protein